MRGSRLPSTRSCALSQRSPKRTPPWVMWLARTHHRPSRPRNRSPLIHRCLVSRNHPYIIPVIWEKAGIRSRVLPADIRQPAEPYGTDEVCVTRDPAGVPVTQRQRELARRSTPASHGPIVPHTAGVVFAGADRGKLPLQWRRLAVFIIAPAGHGAVLSHPTGVVSPSADRGKLPFRWRRLPNYVAFRIIVPAPAGHGAILLHPTVVQHPGADRGKLPIGWRRFATEITSPAGQRPVFPHPAGVKLASADRGKFPFWGCRLAYYVASYI